MRAEFLEQPADALPSRLDGSCRSVSQQRLELGEHLFDRVEVRTVGRQEEQLGARCADRSTHRAALWLPRLSITTMSPARKVGARNCVT
jgi:hypothetical protein